MSSATSSIELAMVYRLSRNVGVAGFFSRPALDLEQDWH
jgi:hypothetical protein